MVNNYTGYIYHEGDKLAAGANQRGQVRSQNMRISLHWLYEHHPGNQSQYLHDNMNYLYDLGLNSEECYNEAACFGQGFDKDLNKIRSSMVSTSVKTAYDSVSWTMTCHGRFHGSVIADERNVGLAPYSGAELCTSVETIHSLSYPYQALGTNYYADTAGITPFNTLPAML
ncbi:hypothetical protein LTR17_027383 [Elasticomyces elasticus]|nr:hypothetical protein LTR17_027383 [Elasticomyces elasticus]